MGYFPRQMGKWHHQIDGISESMKLLQSDLALQLRGRLDDVSSQFGDCKSQVLSILMTPYVQRCLTP